MAIWADALNRAAMSRILSRYLPLYIVTEYPKSGGTWLGQMIAAYLCIPFPRNRRARLESSLHHAHYLYSPLLNNVVCVWRDGRDVMVSLYYHMLFNNERNSERLVRRTRRDLQFADYDDISENLPTFIEYVFCKHSGSISPFQFSWSEFVQSWFGRDAIHVKYEDLVARPLVEMTRVLTELSGEAIDEGRLEDIIDRFSFKNQTGRAPGEELSGSFLRKGVPGDWKGKFSSRAAVVFDQLAGSELIALKYETDHNWIHSDKW